MGSSHSSLNVISTLDVVVEHLWIVECAIASSPSQCHQLKRIVHVLSDHYTLIREGSHLFQVVDLELVGESTFGKWSLVRVVRRDSEFAQNWMRACERDMVFVLHPPDTAQVCSQEHGFQTPLR